MNLEKLLKQDKISKLKTNERKPLKTLEIAERDLETTKDLFKNEDYDWVLITSYNAMLQASRAYMYSKGYRPKGPHKHLSTVQFLQCFQETFDQSTINLFDRVRKRRHATVYDEPETVSRSEAKKTIKQAEKLMGKIKEEIT